MSQYDVFDCYIDKTKLHHNIEKSNEKGGKYIDSIEIVLIIQAVKSGDRQQYSAIITSYQQQIFKYCFHMLGQLQEAEDVTQDVFIKGLDRIGQYRDTISIKAWLYKIAYRECLNKLKRAKAYNRILHLFAQTITSVQSESMNEALTYNEELQSALLRLSPKDRHIVLLRIVEDLRFQDIAEQLDMSYSATRKRYDRALKKLRHYITSKEASNDERSLSY